MNGTISYDVKKKQWRIEASPHIAIRLRRCFGKLSRKHHGTLFLSDTEENARDLEWFIERYPMRVDDIARLRARAAAHKERTALVDALLAKKVSPPTFDLAIPPREYQRIAAALALQTTGLLLADDVGVGKTISAICMLTDRRALPALVVTLTHLPKQWEAEINRFAPKLRTHILKKATPYDLTAAKERGRQLSLPPAHALPDVIITSYSKLAGWAETLAPIIEGHALILDEVQELRNMGSSGKERPAKYSAAKHLAEYAGFRLGASATPIHNYGGEFFAVLDILRPDVLGTKTEFLEEWCKATYGDKPKISDPAAFGAYVRESGLMLRRTRADVGREIPPITKVHHPVEADTEALDKVSASCAELARTILKQGESARGEKLHASEEFSNRLRQATGIAKAPYVADFVRLLVESGEKVLLYGWHREVYQVWLDRLADLKPVMYTGSESPQEKERSKQAFVDFDSKVLIMSLRAGAGLDGLQGVCRTAVFGELDWSPAVHEQAVGRIARDGQTDPVVAYFLVSEHGADPVIVDVLGLKREQLLGVRDPGAELVERLEVDGDRIKRLAASYLVQRGLPAPSAEVAA